MKEESALGNIIVFERIGNDSRRGGGKGRVKIKGDKEKDEEDEEEKERFR